MAFNITVNSAHVENTAGGFMGDDVLSNFISSWMDIIDTFATFVSPPDGMPIGDQYDCYYEFSEPVEGTSQLKKPEWSDNYRK